MSTATATTASGEVVTSDADARPRPVADALTIAWRNLVTIWRNPQLLVLATIQPVLLVLMFTYVFGGAIKVPGGSYVDYLMPGIFLQTVVFGAMNTGIGIAEDLQKGLVDRFRSLPMARSALLIGRTLGDVVRNVFTVLLMVLVGYLVGWRIHTPLFVAIAGLVLVVLFAYAMSWVFAFIGLVGKNVETVQAATFPIIMPLVFASSSFVPVKTMPDWLRVWAENQPLSKTVDAVRALTIGGPTSSLVLEALAWIVGITVLFAAVAVRRYRRVT
jgi:ABC-2 type transport system permease protein